MSAADRWEKRRELLDEIVALQMAMQVSPEAETRAALAQAREALRQHDAESVARFEVAIRKEAAE